MQMADAPRASGSLEPALDLARKSPADWPKGGARAAAPKASCAHKLWH